MSGPGRPRSGIIKTKPSNEQYREGWEAIFGSKAEQVVKCVDEKGNVIPGAFGGVMPIGWKPDQLRK